jgi:hypothetical protein
MKKTLATIAALLMTAATYGQGEVNFANRIAGGVLEQPILLTGSTTTGPGGIAGTVAQLLLVNGTSVTPIGVPIAFSTSTSATAGGGRFFNGGAVTVPGVAAGATATLRVRVSGPGLVGGGADSANFQQALGGGTLPAENMLNFVGFSVTPIPEPTTIALGVLGAAALIAARRRK